jgi:excisionase family DNA binding protein
MTNDDRITTTEAAEILGRTRQWIWQLCKTGELSAVKKGRDWLITRASVEAKKKKMEKPSEIDS